MDNDGRIILSSPSQVIDYNNRDLQIATAPDGNGGLYMALYKSALTINNREITDMTAIDHIIKQGVKYIQIYGVDNACVRV